jgi:imidazoleglycerol-phosphate dehydratase
MNGQEFPMRRAEVNRETGETQIKLSLNLDGTGKTEINTGIGFLDHMLTLLGRHALMDMTIKAVGDLHVDFHHTAEDVGIALGQAFREALGDKKGIVRYADCLMPMDETLTRVALDISGRPFLVFRTRFPTPKVGEFDTELVREWFQAFAINAGITLHVETLYGDNSHHIAESCYKGLARVLRQAVAVDARAKDMVPSTKGTLSK